MVIYEVNLSVEDEIKEKFNKWLDKHITEMLDFHGFLGFSKSFNSVDEKEIVVSYFLTCKADLNDYLSNNAKTMRDDGIKKFGSRFSATRRILDVDKSKLDITLDKSI